MTVQRLDSEEERKLLRKGESTSFEAQSLTLLGFLPQEHMGKKCPRKPKPHHQRCWDISGFPYGLHVCLFKHVALDLEAAAAKPWSVKQWLS